jgi:DNA-binding NtrC family response regulator
LVAKALHASRCMKEVVSYQPLLESEDYDLGIVGRSEKMQNVFKLIGQLAGSDATALITGESGTGKELVARAIYSHSKRANQPFLAINCAAIPENLLESELFGHEKGAFTGASTQRMGKFEQCHNGTIFLDEIGEMSMATQAKILRVLQSGTFERVGGNKPLTVNVRIIAATNKSLERAVLAREFREDLFYRLNVVRIHLPALKERPEDIQLLLNYFLKKMAQKQGVNPKSITADALRELQNYSWPGNVRELENAIERAMVVAKGEAILLQDLPPEITGSAVLAEESKQQQISQAPGQTSQAVQTPSELAKALFEWARKESRLKIMPLVERELIIAALKETKGNQVQSAKLLGMTRATLRKRIDKFQIKQELTVQ